MRILIEVPTYDGRIGPATSQSLWRLDRCGHEVDYRPRSGYGVAMARNRIAADAMNANYDRVLMVDNDIELPQDALKLLLEHDEGVALGWYLNRYERGEQRLSTLYKRGIGWEMFEANDLRARADRGETRIRVKAGGLGCALIRTEVFDRVGFPWFEWADYARERLDVPTAYDSHDAFTSGGEDINFCLRCTTADVQVIADPRVACGHEFRQVLYG